ncbi:futalosine hydrolase [Desulfovibrio sp. TomC]|uniref:futalosine hydrolase n=1 Tax=Desulfovibrio sp. TomC TaxID=1562888 RepID=UPI000574531A|nr:futalosine hydrolase [Desulfovibrio sp. TomC]KHK03860.1 Menaquinone via futalosine step 2 [Desulfovibrio sp. TomC]
MPRPASFPGPAAAPHAAHPAGPGSVSPAPSGRLLLVLATAKEYRAALSGLGAPAPPAPGETVAWRRGGREYCVLVSGVGPVAAAMAAGRAIGRAQATPGRELGGVVGLGIAGSFDLNALPLGGVVAATAEIFPEYGLRRPDGAAAADARGMAFPQTTIDGHDIYDRLPLPPPAEAARAMGLTLPETAVIGPCLTVAGVTASADRAAGLIRTTAALAESMEGFAVALCAVSAGLPALEVRVISNRVGSRPPADWDLPGAFAALGRAAACLFS